MAALNNSLGVDFRLWPHDIRGSKAWVSALRGAGILDAAEEAQLLRGLDRVAERLVDGVLGATDEDVHSLVERLLFDEIGDLAGKLHTGRSRNDQVSTDLRLWCIEALDLIDEELSALGRTLLERARQSVDYILPGYTHGQQAQPVRWAFVLLAHAWPLARDRDRLGVVRDRVAALPLGSGAVAGSGVPVDRVMLKEVLGFRTVCENALDATGDRDFVVEMLFAITLIATHLSRLGGELVTYNSSEYGFIRLADEYSTGSSLMPQKRNPDVFELARAKASRTLGSLVAMLSNLRGLPAGYSKDLQEDKPALFDAVDTLLTTLPAVRGALATMIPDPDRMLAALRDTLLATDVADELVREGVPFRRAHGLVGELVRLAEAEDSDIGSMAPSKALEIHPALPGILERLGSFDAAVDRRVTDGGTSRRSVTAQMEELRLVFAEPS